MVATGVSIKKGGWNLPTSPWYNFFESREVEPFSDKECRALITNPVKGFYKFDKKAIDFIIERTNGKPFYIQKICKKVISKILDDKRRKVFGSFSLRIYCFVVVSPSYVRQLALFNKVGILLSIRMVSNVDAFFVVLMFFVWRGEKCSCVWLRRWALLACKLL